MQVLDLSVRVGIGPIVLLAVYAERPGDDEPFSMCQPSPNVKAMFSCSPWRARCEQNSTSYMYICHALLVGVNVTTLIDTPGSINQSAGLFPAVLGTPVAG